MHMFQQDGQKCAHGYGAGHKVGANVSAKINGDHVYVYCDLVF